MTTIPWKKARRIPLPVLEFIEENICKGEIITEGNLRNVQRVMAAVYGFGFDDGIMGTHAVRYDFQTGETLIRNLSLKFTHKENLLTILPEIPNATERVLYMFICEKLMDHRGSWKDHFDREDIELTKEVIDILKEDAPKHWEVSDDPKVCEFAERYPLNYLNALIHTVKGKECPLLKGIGFGAQEAVLHGEKSLEKNGVEKSIIKKNNERR